MHNFLFLLTILYAFIIRFFWIGKVPHLFSVSLIEQRLISVVISIGSMILVYLYAKKILKSKTLALLSSFVFSLIPWTIEQGRIISQVNNALFIFLIMLILIEVIISHPRRSRKKSRPKLSWISYCYIIILCSITLLSFYFVYPQFWLFRTKILLPKISDFLNNIFFMMSSDFLFFKNPTFWWGGVREVGIMHLSFLPFILVGIYQLFSESKFNRFFLLVFLLCFSSASPFFTESREFFLATPFLSIMTAIGMGSFFSQKHIFTRVIFFLIFCFFLYDMAQFLHYYFIHYPQQIISNLSHINESF